MEKNFMSSKEKNITFHQVWEWIQKISRFDDMCSFGDLNYSKCINFTG